MSKYAIILTTLSSSPTTLHWHT